MVKPNRHAASDLLRILALDAKRRQCSTCTHEETQFFRQYEHACLSLADYTLSRGMHYCLVHLPSLGKEYDKALSSRMFDMKELVHGDGSMGERLTRVHPGFIEQLLYHHIDESSGYLMNPEPEEVFFMRVLFNFFKKLKVDCPPTTVKEAVHDFITIDQDLRNPSGTWDRDSWIPQRHRFCDASDLIGTSSTRARLWGTVDSVFGAIAPRAEVCTFSLKPAHGPGSVADLKTGTDKYLFPFWPAKLDQTFPYTAFAVHNECIKIPEDMTLVCSPKEPPAKLHAVPKTFKGPRLITSEPTAHQFLQQGLLKWIRENSSPLLRNSIDFLNQEKSQDAALQASIRGDLATVDLSSASDRLSCWTVERAFGVNQSLLRCLHAVRTRIIVDATGTDPELSLRMKKFAGQGNAVTFPIQTIVYTGFAISAGLVYENLKPTPQNIRRMGRKVRVFGDDIILPRKHVPLLTLMLEENQLKVNGKKSHISGAFRESCGMDAYKGTDVTPLYISHLEWDKSPDKFQSWIDVSNNAHRKGLWELSSYMYNQVPKSFRRLAVISRTEGDGLRLFSFSKGFQANGQSRWCKNRHEYLFKTIGFRSKVQKKGRGTWQDLYQWLVEAPSPQSKWTAGYLTKETSRICEVWVPTEDG